MTLQQAFKAASIAHAFTHEAYIICSGIDPHGLFYHFVQADKYNKLTDGRCVRTVN